MKITSIADSTNPLAVRLATIVNKSTYTPPIVTSAPKLEKLPGELADILPWMMPSDAEVHRYNEWVAKEKALSDEIVQSVNIGLGVNNE